MICRLKYLARTKYFKMLAILNPNYSVYYVFAIVNLQVLKRDLKRAKWLDDSTTDLGLIR